LLTQTAVQIIQFSPDLLQRLLLIALIIAATWVVSKLLGGIVSKTLGRINPKVARQARLVVVWIVWLTGIVLALNQLGLELTWLLAVVAIGALIVVIVSRDFLSNLSARETIYLYNQFKIGDWIQVGEIFGRVVDVTWNYKVLCTLNNEIVYVPKSTITRSVIINKPTPEGIRISVPITVYKSLGLQDVEEASLGIGTELQEELVSESKPEGRLVNIGPKTTKLELLLRINNPAKSRFVSSEVMKRIKKKLQENQ